MSRDLLESVVLAVARVGGPASEIGVRLDLARSTGLRAGLHRWREERQARTATGGRLADPYRGLWLDAAGALGATVDDLPDGSLALSADGRRTVVRGRQVAIDGPAALARALDKALARDLIAARGVPVPPAVAYTAAEIGLARSFLAATNGPCVVKPAADTDAGSGVTSGVRTHGQLARATLRASRLRPRLLLERQLEGLLHRVLVLDGRIIAAVRRLPPSVLGDGVTSVAALIAAQNKISIAGDDRPGASLLRIDLDCVFTLAAGGRTLRTVPGAGERVVVKGVASQNAAAETFTVDPTTIEASVAGAVLAAAEALGLRLAGVDVIASDLGQPLAASGGGIIEVNGTPGLLYHYRVADPATATPVARPILRSLLGEAP